jgi:hypothetical protein
MANIQPTLTDWAINAFISTNCDIRTIHELAMGCGVCSINWGPGALRWLRHAAARVVGHGATRALSQAMAAMDVVRG